MACFTSDAPPPRDYAGETRDTLQAQIDLAPAKYAAEAQFAPKYADLQMQLLQKSAPALIDIYKNQIAPGLAQTQVASQSATRVGDIADVTNLGPQARAALQAMNPEQAKLVDTMTRQAQQGLDAGSQLTPYQANQAQQQARQAWADRGLVTSPGSGVQEVVNQQLAGMGTQQQRQQSALGSLAASQSFYGDPMQQILGRPSQAFGAMQGFGQQAQGFNPGQLFNPESQYAGDINNQAYQAQLQTGMANAANMTGILGAGLGAAGSAASSL